MHSMLDQFYNYLSEKIIEFFKNNPLTSGAKYNVQFETEDQVKALYETLEDNFLSKEYRYEDKDGVVKYTSYLLDFEGVKLIVASTMNNVQPDFLTRLRNMVGMEPGYEDKAILFIHNTTLDSIMGGTESFSKEGMPFHIDSIQKDIKAKLANSEFTEVDKAIIDLDLDRKKNDLFSDNSSVFEYKELLEIINGTSIEKDQYKNFALFPDSELSKLTGKELKNRLKANATNFARVDDIHNYGNPELQLERYFDDKGIDKLKGKDWKVVDFKEVSKSLDEKKKITPLQYKSCSLEWDKEEGRSKAKSRIRNVIVFNESGAETVEVEFTFDDHLSKNNVKVEFGELDVNVSGKRIKASLKNTPGQANFYRITYKDEKNVKFEFKIIMVDCDEKYLESIKTNFSIVMKKKNNYYIEVKTNEPSIVFNEFAQNNTVYTLEDNYQTISLDDEQLTVKIGDNFKYENDSDLVKFNVKIGESVIPFGITGTNEKITSIEGFNVWKLKREKQCDFKLVGDNKIQYGTKEHFTRDEFRKNIEIEKKIVELEGLYFEESTDGIETVNIEVDSKIADTYNHIIKYFQLRNSIPSLTYISSDVKQLYEAFLRAFIEELNSIKEGDYVTKRERDLFKIGVIKRRIEDKEILFTPLHPLNIAYQLKLNEEIENQVLADEVIKKFTSTYLLPYISEDDKLYVPMEQHHSPEWKYYVDQKLPRYKSSRAFVAKLVDEKIEEFIGHFKYMFNMGNSAPIRINLINTGDSKEILQGIFKYYVKQIRGSKSNVLPIEVFIYSDKNITNAFEEAAFNDDIESLKAIYGIDLNVDGVSEEDVLNLYREKVHFYSKKLEEGVEYAHITFIEMNDVVKTVTSKMKDIPSGVILNGLTSGVPSVFLGDSYRTGFGSKYTNTDSDLMTVTMKLNALNAALTGEPFSSDQCKAISIPNNSKSVLDKIYDASHWVTFIDPKVDLNFFKNDPDAKDLLIIHYSDQYTTAGGYDAITVTRKSGPYQRVIEEFLEKKDVENVSDHSPSIINMFNAINGDWLLRLLSSKSHFPKEKISILSAIKLALAEFKRDNIIWVPISLEEVLRVSGGAGLKQTEGFFSAKNLGFEKNGATSDDILLVGIEENSEGKVFVHYYPIEVKIGENNKAYIEKGVEQAKSTKKIFNETLLPGEDGRITATQSVYRNFLMQLVITSAEKLNLYEVCSEENWKSVIDSDLRRKLLNEEYDIVNTLVGKMGEAAVISFKRGSQFNDKRIEDGVMILEMSEDEGINFITKSVKEIRELVDGKDESYPEIPEKIIAVGVEPEDDIDGVVLTPPEILTPDEELPKPIGIVADPKPEDIVDITTEPERNMEVLFGTNQNNSKEIYWYPNDTDKVFHTNTGIIGTMGTGKTQFTKSMITQIYRESKYNVDGKKIGILIFDYKGDYNKSKEDFVEATDAKVFELYHLPFNPLSIVKTPNAKPMLPLHTANTLKETIAKAFGLGIKQETLLRDLIIEAYEKNGISKANRATWDNPAPTLKDVYDIYTSKEDLKEDSLYAAFSNLIDFEVFEPNSSKTQGLFELIDGVTVIDLSGYDPGIQNLVVAIMLDLFYSQMQAYGHSKIDGSKRQLNKMILVDEADNFLSKNFEALKKILKEGREFGVGTILSTQLLSHFSTGENDYANYILTWIIHNVADLSNKDVKYIFNTQSKAEEENLCSKIKSLKKHYSLVKMGDSEKSMYMKDKAFWELEK